MPPYKVGLPWEDGFTWEFVELRAVLSFGGALASSSAAGGSLSAKNWFKGPVRMGTEEELEQMEEEQLGEFDIPTEAEPA